MTRLVLVVAASAIVLVGACGTERAGESAVQPSVDPSTLSADDDHSEESDLPDLNSVQVSHDGTSLDLEPWTSCWSEPGAMESYCADGAPPVEPPDLGVIRPRVVRDGDHP